MIRIENVADVQTAIASAVEAVRDGTVEVVSAVSEPGDLVMVAVRSADSSIDPVAVCDGCDCLAALPADRVVFVQWDAAPRLFVANAFRHVNVIRTVIEDDALVGSPVAKVVVDNADLEDAFGQDGIQPRLAAMLTQTNIEIILPHEVTDG